MRQPWIGGVTRDGDNGHGFSGPDPAGGFADPARCALRQSSEDASAPEPGRPIHLLPRAEGRGAERMARALWAARVRRNRMTDDTKRGIRAHEWAADARHVLFLQDEGGDENWRVLQRGRGKRQAARPHSAERRAGADRRRFAPQAHYGARRPSTIALPNGTTSTRSTSIPVSARWSRRTRAAMPATFLTWICSRGWRSRRWTRAAARFSVAPSKAG